MSNILGQNWLLNRRHFLRGAGAAVALPLLDCMTPLRARRPAAAGKPRRSVFVYIPNGVNVLTWQITKAGRGLRAQRAAEAAGKAPGRTSRRSAACTTPAASARRTSAPRPGSPAAKISQEGGAFHNTRVVRPADGRGHRRRRRASARWSFRSRPASASRTTRHAGLVARRRAAAGRGQPADGLQPPVRRRAGRRRRPAAAAEPAAQRARRRARRRQVAAQRTSAARTAPSSTSTCTRCATWKSAPSGSTPG